jgi:hypothetical protein
LWIKEDEEIRNNNTLSKDKLELLECIEAKDCIFPEMDYMLYY